MNKGRRGLYFLAAAGLLSLGVGGGTFATFNAETTNPGNTFSTGSLTLTDNAAATTCFSYSDNGSSTNTNTNGTSCGAAITLNNTNQTGASIATGTVTITNGGSISPTTFQVEGPPANPPTTLASQDCTDSYGSTNQVTNATIAASSATVTMASTSGLVANEGVSGTGIPLGDTILSVDSSTQITLATAATASSSTETLDFSIGQVNIDTSSKTLCDTAGLFAEEVSQTTAGNTVTTNLACAFGTCPNYATLGTAVTSGSTSLALAGTGLAGTINSGDTIELIATTGATATSTTVTVGTGTITATAIPITAGPASGTWGIGTAVLDLNQVPASAAKTLSTFDTGGAISPTLASANWGAAALPSGDSRTYSVGVYLPSSAGNSLQDLSAKFGISWYAAQ